MFRIGKNAMMAAIGQGETAEAVFAGVIKTTYIIINYNLSFNCRVVSLTRIFKASVILINFIDLSRILLIFRSYRFVS